MTAELYNPGPQLKTVAWFVAEFSSCMTCDYVELVPYLGNLLYLSLASQVENYRAEKICSKEENG